MVLSICLSTLYAVLFVVGFFGNLLTALIIIFNSYMRVPPNFFLLSLAVADMITLLGGKKLNIFDKGQLISKCLLGFIVSTKKPTKSF